ncbi:MAG: hypothetical protein NC181_01820 [Clostridium sp.]|nr:hypothetical protein [Clostridium sp.]MCM1444045.1 hypothetical protein [Candidatus Amulumruptor caecigallinarius]
MEKEELKQLNDLLEQAYFEIEELYLEDFKIFKTLNDYIIKNFIDINRIIKYDTRVGLSNSYKYAYDFFNSFNKEYANYLKENWNDEIINKDFVKFNNSNNIAETYMENDKAKIYLPFDKTLFDSYSIVHEIIHHMKIEEANKIGAYNFNILCESLSILSEMLFSDYLIKNNVPLNLINKNKVALMRGIQDKSNIFDLDYYLLERYIYNGNISNYDISKYLNNSPISICKYFYYTLSEILDRGILSIFFESRYIIGVFIASYMHERIQENPKNIDEFIELNDNINKMDILDIFKYLELDVINDNNGFIDFSTETYQKLFKSYKKEFSNL